MILFWPLDRRLWLCSALWAVALAGCRPYVIQSGTWSFRGHPIAYEKAQVIRNEDSSTTSVISGSTACQPILLLNGFGVGSFHQHRLMDALLQQEQHQHRVLYAMDYLGQGQSWPLDCNDGQSDSERGLRYCGGTWLEQITQFIEHVILPSVSQQQQPPNKVHIVGNSVGGHLGVFVAATRPDLVETLCLLNATPVWGANLPGWSGHLPAPWLPRWIGRYLFDRMRDLSTIESFLESCYANRPAWYGTQLMQQIRECTEGPGGHAAFASILWSPAITVALPASQNGPGHDNDLTVAQANFEACLRALSCDVLLIFGREDPWCTPAFAKRMMWDLAHPQRQQLGSGGDAPVHRYVELSPVGHCPNHEAPQAVADLITRWLDASDRRPEALSLIDPALAKGDSESSMDEKVARVEETWGQVSVQELAEADIPLTFLERLAFRFL